MSSFQFPTCTPESLALATGDIPALAFIISSIQNMLDNTDTTITDVGDLLRLDASLSARVLTISNSVHFGGETRCNTIEDALNRVGFREVYRLVTLIASSAIVAAPLPAYGLSAEQAWHHSVGCAIGAERMALRFGENPSVAYTIGLLHAIGRQPINTFLQAQCPEMIMEDQGVPGHFSNEERELLGFTHEKVSAALLHQWKFPAVIVDPLLILSDSQIVTGPSVQMRDLVDLSRLLYDCSFTLKGQSLPWAIEAKMDIAGFSKGDFRELGAELHEELERAIQISHY